MGRRRWRWPPPIPTRVRKLALFGTYARGSGIAPPDSRDAFVAFTRSSWGLASRTMTDLFDPGASAEQIKAVAEDQLACASAGMAADLLALTYDMDVSDAAPRVQAPTLVMHRLSDRAIRYRLGEELATLIPGATLRTLEGEEHLPWSGDRAAAVAEIELFLTGRRTVAVTRKLATVMFSDIVGSTEQASASGDERWRRVLDVHDHELRRQLEHFGGRAVKYLGDGALALFDLPTAAIRCAAALRQHLATEGLSLRVGIHTGEIEERDRDVAGIAVHIAARIEGVAEPGDIVVSNTTKELASGSDLAFTDLGEHTLRGIPQAWRLFRFEE